VDLSPTTAPGPAGPLAAVARAELRLHLRRRGYWLLFGLFAALVLCAAALNGVRQQRERARQTDLQALVRAQWEGQPERHPHRVAHYGTFAFKPPGPLAAFDPGVDSYAGRSLYLEAHRQNAANFAEAGELSSAFRLGELSLAFVLQLVLPLVVIALGHRAVAADAESGRLRLLLAQGLAPRPLLFGKLAGLAAALVPFFAVAAVASLVALVADPAFRADLSGLPELDLEGPHIARRQPLPRPLRRRRRRGDSDRHRRQRPRFRTQPEQAPHRLPEPFPEPVVKRQVHPRHERRRRALGEQPPLDRQPVPRARAVEPTLRRRKRRLQHLLRLRPRIDRQRPHLAPALDALFRPAQPKHRRVRLRAAADRERHEFFQRMDGERDHGGAATAAARPAPPPGPAPTKICSALPLSEFPPHPPPPPPASLTPSRSFGPLVH